MCGIPSETDNFESSDSQGNLISSEEVVPSAPALELLPISPLTEEVNPPLSVQQAETFPEGNARQDNTDGPRGPQIVASRPGTRLKAKQGPREEEESVVLEKMC